MNRFEWAVNIQRDSYASYIGHYPLLSYFAIAENESIGRQRYTFMQVSFFFSYYFLLGFTNSVLSGSR
jgi:splicing factor 3B subunit 5